MPLGAISVTLKIIERHFERSSVVDADATQLVTLYVAGRKGYSGPTRQLANQLLISGLVNLAECNLTKLYMLIGFWPVSLNRSSVAVVAEPCLFSSVITDRCLATCTGMAQSLYAD